MSVFLLERDQFLGTLAGLLDEVMSGTGRCALVSGEAGIGKSALTDRFIELYGDSVRFCLGRCEALFTPMPLGPLHDIAPQVQGRVLELLKHEADRSAIFSAFLEALADSPLPTVVIIEDVHWADEATLDLLKFLGRRIQHVPVLLIITYRDDEIGPDHPLWFVLGDLPSRATRRLHLPPLSRDAVAALARDAQRSSNHLYEVTGGNPFFVTEVLASDEEGVPETVRDAVLARVARLSPQGHAVLQLVSVVPARTELWLLEAILPETKNAIEECMRAGVLHPEVETVAFRHELARQALESTLPSLRLKELHIEVLRALLASERKPATVARLVHHAALAGDGAAVLRFAPDAARQAAQQGAHREAAIHYETALHYAEGLSQAQRAELLEGRAYECYLTSQLEDAVEACAEALAVWRELGESDKVGHSMRWLSRLSWFLGDKAAAEYYAAEAVAALEALPPDKELALAYSNLAQLRMLEANTPGAMQWGMKALDLAETLDDDEIKAHALNNMGTAQFLHGDEDGCKRLEASLAIALEHGLEEHAARAFTNLGGISVGLRQYARASRYLEEGILYCTEHDLDSWRLYMTGSRAGVRLDVGDWAGAADDAAEVLTRYRVPPAIRIQALIIQAWIRLRRGDPGSAPILDEAKTMALKMGEPQRIVPVATARAEAAWLRGDQAACRAEARVGYEFASELADPWALGQLLYWLWKTGDPLAVRPGLPEPYALQFTGDWRLATAAWERIGCPYEQALALAEGDAPARRAALTILDRLGARATLERLNQQLSAGHVHGVSRGPISSTRANPAGLTNQQLEVLRLMADGLHNAEIAQILQVSSKTVEHHVSAVLTKLNARSRAQAVSEGHNLGVIANIGERRRQI
jgi:DNA-binding CsgD family transcriptional regulator/tetratricopeptide (TPR) repeat protein